MGQSFLVGAVTEVEEEIGLYPNAPLEDELGLFATHAAHLLAVPHISLCACTGGRTLVLLVRVGDCGLVGCGE